MLWGEGTIKLATSPDLKSWTPLHPPNDRFEPGHCVWLGWLQLKLELMLRCWAMAGGAEVSFTLALVAGTVIWFTLPLRVPLDLSLSLETLSWIQQPWLAVFLSVADVDSLGVLTRWSRDQLP